MAAPEPPRKERGPFPFDAPTPSGYVVGVGRGARPVKDRLNEGRQAPKADKVASAGADNQWITEADQAAEDASLRAATAGSHAVEDAEKTGMGRLVREACKTVRDAVPSAEDWDAIPEVEASKRYKSQKVDSHATAMARIGHETRKAVVASALTAVSSTFGEVTMGAEEETSLLAYYADPMNETQRRKALSHYKSAVELDPTAPGNWIGLAEAYEAVSDPMKARKALQEACEKIPSDESLWAELVRVTQPHKRKDAATRAIKAVPKSARLCLLLAHCAETNDERLAVIMSGVERNPASTLLWKQALVLCPDREASRLLLRQALRHAPDLEMFLALAAVEAPDIARRVLNEAYKKYPEAIEVYVAAACLEAATDGNGAKVDAHIRRGVDTVRCTRHVWYEHAAKCSAPAAARAIIVAAMHIDVDVAKDKDAKKTWIGDADIFLQQDPPNVLCARAVYAHACEVFPAKKGLWVRRATLELIHGGDAVRVAAEGIAKCPGCAKLTVILAKAHRDKGSADGARGVLEDAVRSHPKDEEVWVSFCIAAEDHDAAMGIGGGDGVRGVLQRACKECDTPRMYMKLAVFERRVKGPGDSSVRAVLDAAIAKGGAFEGDWKLWTMLLQWHLVHATKANAQQAREVSQRALLAVGAKHAAVWLAAIDIEQRIGDVGRGRTLFDKARKIRSQDAAVWCAAIRFEWSNNNKTVAKKYAGLALQIFQPGSKHSNPDALGMIHAVTIELETVALKKPAIRAAMQQCAGHGHVHLQIALYHHAVAEPHEAAAEAEKAVAAAPTLGDAWALVCVIGGREREVDALRAKPKHGALWISVSKDPRVCGLRECSLTAEHVLHATMKNLPR